MYVGLATCLVLYSLCVSSSGANISTQHVETEREFLDAVRDHSTRFIVLKRNLTLHSSNPVWQGTPAASVRRDLTISGATHTQQLQQPTKQGHQPADCPADASGEPSTWAVLDLAFLRDKIALAPNVIITFQHIILKRSYVEWIPGIHFLQYAPNATVRLHKAVRELPACPKDLDWLRQVVQNHNVPPGYTPPAHLYPDPSRPSVWSDSRTGGSGTDQAATQPFTNLLQTVNQQQCRSRWMHPATCSSQGLIVTRLAYDVPRQPDRRFAHMYVGFDETFESYYPCLSYLSDACVQQQGYPACFTQAAVKAAQLAALQDRKGNFWIALSATSLLILLAYVWWTVAGMQYANPAAAEHSRQVTQDAADIPVCNSPAKYNSSSKQRDTAAPLEHLCSQVSQLKASRAAVSTPALKGSTATAPATQALGTLEQHRDKTLPASEAAGVAAVMSVDKQTPAEPGATYGPWGSHTGGPANNPAEQPASDCRHETVSAAADASTSTAAAAATAAVKTSKAMSVEVSLDDYDSDADGCDENSAAAGEQLQGLTLGALIGAGSFGRVYKGDWKSQTVAVKVMEVQQHQDFRQVRYELAVNQMLQHPNIVRCLAYRLNMLEPECAFESSDLLHNPHGPSVEQPAAAAAPGLLQDHSSSINSGSGGADEGRGIISSSNLQQAGAVVVGNHAQPEFQYQAAAQSTLTWMQVSLVMEYCNCGTLHDAVMNGLLRGRAGNTSTSYSNMAAVLQIALDIAKGMAYMHSRNICHGDLCCKNVLLVSAVATAGPLAVEAKIADFGLSRLVPQQNTHLSTLTHGTLTHMAPELLLSHKLRPSADVYSFGIVLWELVHLGATINCNSSNGSSFSSNSSSSTVPPLQAAEQQAAVQTSSSGAAAAGFKRCTRIYHHLGSSSPWAIMQHVIHGGRPVFMAPAVPGHYVKLTQRCWNQEPSQRPGFNDIVQLLEQGVQEQLGTGRRQDLVGSWLMRLVMVQVYVSVWEQLKLLHNSLVAFGRLDTAWQQTQELHLQQQQEHAALLLLCRGMLQLHVSKWRIHSVWTAADYVANYALQAMRSCWGSQPIGAVVGYLTDLQPPCCP